MNALRPNAGIHCYIKLSGAFTAVFFTIVVCVVVVLSFLPLLLLSDGRSIHMKLADLKKSPWVFLFCELGKKNGANVSKQSHRIIGLER